MTNTTARPFTADVIATDEPAYQRLSRFAFYSIQLDMTMTIASTNAPTTKRLSELELSERIIRDYILSLDECDALRYTVTATTIQYTPYACNDSGAYEQANYCPRFFDLADLSREEEATLLAALWQLSVDNFADGVIAVDPDSGDVVLYRS